MDERTQAGLNRDLCSILRTMLFGQTKAIYSHNLSNSRNREKSLIRWSIGIAHSTTQINGKKVENKYSRKQDPWSQLQLDRIKGWVSSSWKQFSANLGKIPVYDVRENLRHE